jgi:uncharacterized protein (TIGR03118 family)
LNQQQPQFFAYPENPKKFNILSLLKKQNKEKRIFIKPYKRLYMKKITLNSTFTVGLIPLLTLFFLNLGCQKNFEKNPHQKIPASSQSSEKEKVPQSLKDFTQVNLVGDNDEYNPATIDSVLVNAWGLAFSSGGTPWISAEATGKSTIYNKDGVILGLSPVSIPSPTDTVGGHPTGIVFNGSADFILPNGRPARFIFAGDDGVISGWNGGTSAKRAVNNPATAGYFGLALAIDGGNNFLYAANFVEGKIDVFDKNWAAVTKPFTDPNLPAAYSPFNIQAIDNLLYVMYAKVGPDGDEIAHAGFGLVDIFNPDGSFVKRFISYGQLNAPWGIAKAPAGFYGSGFGDIQNTFLVGNFGDGRINAYNWDGTFLGQLRAHGNPIVIEGLWAISFAPATATTVDPNRLYFTAGPDDEEEGLFGYIIK